MISNRLDSGTAELLLAGGAGAWGSGHHRLAGVLAAAVAPGRPGELVREDAMVAAFRAARYVPSADGPLATGTGPQARLAGVAAVLAAVTVDSGDGRYLLYEDYLGIDRAQCGRALAEPTFRVLAAQAGGRDRDKADRLCEELLDRPSGLPSPQTGRSGH